MYAGLAPFLVVALFPVLWMTITAFKHERELYAMRGVPFWLHEGPTLKHFHLLFTQTWFGSWVLNTALVSALVVAITVVLAVPAGYALARLRPPGGGTAAVAIFVTYLVPPIALFLPLTFIVARLGLLDSRWALVLVYLVIDRPAYTAFDAHYFPSLANPVSRLSEPKRYRDGDDPTDRTVLCAEVPCTVGDEVWDSSDADLQALVEQSLAGERLPRIDSRAVVTRRLSRVYPVYRVGFEHDLEALDGWLSTKQRLLVFGRQGLFEQDNTHHVLAMGMAAADALTPDGGFDHMRWRRALDRFAGHIVED